MISWSDIKTPEEMEVALRDFLGPDVPIDKIQDLVGNIVYMSRFTYMMGWRHGKDGYDETADRIIRACQLEEFREAEPSGPLH